MTERMESVVPRVELKGIRKSFPGVAALKNVDFTLMPISPWTDGRERCRQVRDAENIARCVSEGCR